MCEQCIELVRGLRSLESDIDRLCLVIQSESSDSVQTISELSNALLDYRSTEDLLVECIKRHRAVRVRARLRTSEIHSEGLRCKFNGFVPPES